MREPAAFSASPAPAERAHPAWAALEAGVAAGFSCLSAFVIARLIGPAEVGIAAAVLAVHIPLWVGVNALFADPLTQSASTDPRELSAVFWASTGVGVLAALAQAACGPLLAQMLDDVRLVPMCLALALPLPLVGAAGAVQGLLVRARRYDLLAARVVLGQGLGVLAGVALALRGAGGWALVAQQLVAGGVGATLLLLRARWRPVRAWRGAPVRAMLRQGLPMTAATLVQLARYRVFLLLVGGMLGPAALGQLHLAFRLVDAVRELMATALWRWLLPVMSERRDDVPALAAMIERSLGRYAVGLFPLCGLMVVALQPLTLLVLGPAWTGSAQATMPLLALLAWSILGFAAHVAAITRGAARLFLAVHLSSLGLTLVGALVWEPESATQAGWLWLGAQLLVLPWMAIGAARLLDLPVVRLYRAGLPALAASVVAVLAAFYLPRLFEESPSALLLLFERVGMFLLAYLALAAPMLRLGGWWMPRLRAVADAAR